MAGESSRPLTKQEADKKREFFLEWRSLEEVRKELEKLRKLVGDHFLDDPHLKWSKEAKIALDYGRAHGSRQIRILRDDPPDFEAMSGMGVVERCEVVEVMKPGRRRGDELRLERQSPPIEAPVPIDNCWISVEDALQAVDAQIEKKAAKPYPERFVLVVYVNVGFLEADDGRFLRQLRDRQTRGHPKFERVYFVYRASDVTALE